MILTKTVQETRLNNSSSDENREFGPGNLIVNDVAGSFIVNLVTLCLRQDNHFAEHPQHQRELKRKQCVKQSPIKRKPK